MCTRPKLLDVGRLSGKGKSQFKFCPCGMCIECRNMRREEYTQRLKHEIIMNDYIASFVSLTYRDDELPLLYPKGSAVVGSYFGSCPPAYGSTLYKNDIKKFCDKLSKRFHRKYGKLSMKYIAVGEYGDDGHRPHYHLIIVGLPASERQMIYDCWNKGRIDIEPVGNGAIRYCLSYIDKQVFGASALYESYGDFQPPFALFSKGIGKTWIDKNLDKFDKYGKITFGDSGKSYTLNPYYRQKYGFENKPYISPFSDSVIDWAEKNKMSLLDAYRDRCYQKELIYQHKQIKNREPLYRCTKSIIRKQIDNELNKKKVDKRYKWYREVTKALLNCDDSYLIMNDNQFKNTAYPEVLKSANNLSQIHELLRLNP